MAIDKKKILEGISSTGFELEFDVSQKLAKSGWTVISNKYYIDDVQGSSREIDILAYKVSKIDELFVYTTLIISCKKSTERSWVLLSKEKELNDPNSDWSPVTLWSNDKIVRYMLEKSNWKSSYVDEAGDKLKKIFEPENHIFAFQEMNLKSGKPQNDKAIFDSVVSAMKSQNYEIESLEKRKREASVYNFNLLSVVDAPIFRAYYSENATVIESVNSDVYVGNYIVGKKETSSRVHFVNSDEFDNVIGIYDQLHDYNIVQAKILRGAYFDKLLEDSKKIKLQINEFTKMLRWSIISTLQKMHTDVSEWDDIKLDIRWDKKAAKAIVSIEDLSWEREKELLTILNDDSELRSKTSKALDKLYKYSGEFEFGLSIPF